MLHSKLIYPLSIKTTYLIDTCVVLMYTGEELKVARN